MSEGLGRRVPKEWTHVERYPLMAGPAAALVTVERTLKLPWWYYEGEHNQGNEGACVGFGMSLMMDIINTAQAGKTFRYIPWWLWDRAKEIDWWPETRPGDDQGTSLDAAATVLRKVGHVPYIPRKTPKDQFLRYGGTDLVRGYAPDPTAGLSENRWATSVDEMRATINLGLPVAIGVNWYASFDRPERLERGLIDEYWVGRGNLGLIRGGHCVCVYGASDRREGFKFANSWGRSYPLSWIPYTTMERLIREEGEVALVTDL